MCMKIQTMILPNKHIRFANSLVAIAGYVKNYLNEPRNVDELWALVNSDSNIISPTFTQLILAIDLLFAIKVVNSDFEGRIHLIHEGSLCD